MFFSAFLTRIYLVIATIFLVAVIAVWFIPRSDISVHAERRPTFDLTTFFDGKTVAYGIFEDRFGNLRRQFRVVIDANREGNMLILDEPTNHLDIAAKEVLEDALRHYEGTVVMVSHDRYFVSQTANTILALEEVRECQWVAGEPEATRRASKSALRTTVGGHGSSKLCASVILPLVNQTAL